MTAGTGSVEIDPLRTSAVKFFALRDFLFDYFVCAQQDRLRHGQAKRLRCPEIDQEIELRGLLDVGRRCCLCREDRAEELTEITTGVSFAPRGWASESRCECGGAIAAFQVRMVLSVGADSPLPWAGGSGLKMIVTRRGR
jgi:hypothetical protein